MADDDIGPSSCVCALTVLKRFICRYLKGTLESHIRIVIGLCCTNLVTKEMHPLGFSI